MKIQITAHTTGTMLFEHEAERNTVALTLAAAVKASANLAGANMANADLAGANLARAYLAGANMAGANLVRAYLAGANMSGANMAGANMAGANLDRAYLACADLDGADLDGEVLNKAPISLINLQWSILITGQYMRIGCQRHTHEEWRDFTDSKIKNMAVGALAFWRKWKAPLLAICHANHEGPSDAPLAEKVVA